MQNLTPPLLLLSLLSLAFSLAAFAETDLAREVREAKGRSQQREKQSQAQSASDLNQARKKAVAAALASKGLKAIAVEVAGYSEEVNGVLVNAKLADGRVCQTSAEESEFASHAGDNDDTSYQVDRGIDQANRELRAMRRLADAQQTRRAEKRIAEASFLDELGSGDRGTLSALVRRVNSYALEAGIKRIQVYGNCYDANGRAKEIGSFLLANKNGAILEPGLGD